MTKSKEIDTIFSAIHDVYESHDGGVIHLGELNTELVKTYLEKLYLLAQLRTVELVKEGVNNE